MKKLVVLSVFAIFFGLTLQAQVPPPPPANATNGGANGPVGGGSAPIGSGIVMLLTMGAGYAMKKSSGELLTSRK